ncbi:RcnB family protein [Novosphingobium flavum]|uniref:RcnB family protein n=1 Tax=Novosphingobium flavum TaxID=1778672 RepID=A0A7X1KM28_9SPHN|nr:RcnB family protein [Novosphingobium flavum]MBC2666194.1 RcnB family protein [Novosphingobium flavum]
MNKYLTAALAAALVLPAAAPAFAKPDNHGQHVSVVAKGNPFRKGQRFEPARAPHYTVINYRGHRGLKAPPRGYHWVRSGNDALLVAISTGVIASVIANSF